MNDLRYALRNLGRQRGFTAVAVLTLALGIGANTAIFSVVNGVLLRPLPYPGSDRIVELWSTTSGDSTDSHAPGEFMDLQRAQRAFAAVAGYREDAVTIATPHADPVRVSGAIVTVDYFDVFGMRAMHGRTFSRSSDDATAEPLVVLSESVWRDRFAADPGIVGRRARLNGVPHTVLGVMPESFNYPADVETWVLSTKPVPLPPVDIRGDLLEAREVRYFQAVARLTPGVSLAQASDDLRTISADLARRYPESSAGRRFAVQPLHERIVGDVRGALLILLGAVGLVLLIACANVSSLLLARGSGRQREMAIRAALGAGRARIMRQLIVESLALALAGGAAGLLAGGWAVAFLTSMLPEGTPRTEQIRLDMTVALVAIGVSGLSALVFGLVPAWQASRTEASSVLRSGDRGATTERRRARARAVLVVAEIALTLVLLVSAGLLANSFLRLQNVHPGFEPDQVTVVSLPIPQSKYIDGKRQAAFYQRVVEGLREHPAIDAAAVLFPSPLQGQNASGEFVIEGRPAPRARSERAAARIASISTGYFSTMGIPILRGRDFTEQDREPAPDVVIVTASLARRYWPGEGDEAIGKRLSFDETGDGWMTIVGIAGDSRNMGLDAAPEPQMYIPFHNFPLPFMSIAARSAAGLAVVSSAVRAEVKRADPELPIDRIAPLREIVADSVAEPRFRTLLIGGFALVATLLAAVGVYGLVSYSVTARTREIGIRIALGASARQVMRPVVREGLALGISGVVLGLIGAAAATRLLSGFLYGVAPTDAWTFSAVALLLLGVALLATYIPSRRALRVDPIAALRAD